MTTQILTKPKRFLRDTGQALFSLLFNVAGLVAGGVVAYNLGIFDTIPWALLIYPGILSIRGAIGGLYAGRLSTALHLGTIKPRIFKNTTESYVLLNTVNALTLISALVMGTLGSVVCILVTGTHFSEFFKILSVIIASMGMSIIVISPLTFWISVTSFNKGLDPDVIVYPIVSTVADLIITAIYIGVLFIVIQLPGESLYIFSLINALFILGVLYLIKDIYKKKEFVSTVKEYMITLLIISIIVNITGTALNGIIEKIGKRPEVFMIYPALIDTVGDVGSIIGSTATTKMAIGVMETEFKAITSHLWEIGSAWTASIIMFILYTLTSSIVYGIEKLPRLLEEVFFTHMIIVPVIIIISFATAIITRKRGLDPDNFVIPIETSISDGLTTIGLLIAFTVLIFI